MKKLQLTNQTTIAKRKQYRNGATSMYIVIFATLLLSVITLSFIQIMTSNVNNTVNDDLSISAYDSALAGIEDAKIALTKYHNCIDQGKTASSSAAVGSCERVIYDMQNGITSDSCDTVSTALGRTSSSNPQPVVIQETSNATDASDSSNMLQAYTCVKVTEDLTDYRGTLTSENRTATVPLRTKDYQKVRALKIMWHEDGTTNNTALGSSLPKYSRSLIPALLVDYYQTANSFNLGQLSTRNGDNVDHGTIFLHPTSTSNISNPVTASGNTISRATVIGLTDKLDNPTVPVTCSNKDGIAFKCAAIINLPIPVGATDGGTAGGISRNASTFFLRLSLPYANETGTTFSVTMCKNDNCAGATSLENTESDEDIAYFTGVQARIDSTGRANDVYRRVDVRVELVETGFPYPEYEIWMVGSGSESDIKKDFWVTKDCKIKRSSESAMEGCDNKGSV